MNNTLVLHGFRRDGTLVIRVEEIKEQDLPSSLRRYVIKVCAGGIVAFEQEITLYPDGPVVVGRLVVVPRTVKLLRGHTDLSILLCGMGGEQLCDPIPFVIPSNLPTN